MGSHFFYRHTLSLSLNIFNDSYTYILLQLDESKVKDIHMACLYSSVVVVVVRYVVSF